jgi:outer membrane receptor for ferrienterochelin and colicins
MAQIVSCFLYTVAPVPHFHVIYSRRTSIWLPFVLCALVPSAWAGQARPADATGDLSKLSLEDLMQVPIDEVYGASKYEQKVTRAPASVTIITADDIDRFGYRNLADVLRSVPGLYVTDDRNYSFLGFRGFSQPGDFNSGILLLVDGHRVNDAIYNLMYIANEGLLDVQTIERVEIIRGPSSSIYGNSAFFGVINLITKRGGQIDGLEASGEIGSLETSRGRIAYGKKFANGIELLASGSRYDSAGQSSLFFQEYANPRNNNGFAIDSDNESVGRTFGSLSWGDFTLSTAFSDRWKRVPTAPAGTAFDTGKGQTIDKRGFVDVRYEHTFSNELKLLGRFSYDWYTYDAVYPYTNPVPGAGLILNQDLARARWTRSELQATRKILDRHTLIVGAEYQDNLRQYQANYDLEPFTDYLHIDHGSRSYAFFGQGEFTLHKRLLLNAGVRYDHFNSFGGTVNPRLGLIYSPAEKSTIKLLYGKAFRAPNDYELNFQSPTFERNPNLQPETIRTYELVFEQYLPTALRVSAAAYRYDIDGLITQVDDPVSGISVFENTAAAHAEGLELQLEGRYASGIVARGSYALQRTEDAHTGQVLSDSPRHLAKLNLSVPLYRNKLYGSLEVQYNSSAITPGRETAPGYMLLNGTVFARKLTKGAGFSFSAYNLLNSRYSTTSTGSLLQETIQQNGRTVRAELTYKF